jgi:hypothetical protein
MLNADKQLLDARLRNEMQQLRCAHEFLRANSFKKHAPIRCCRSEHPKTPTASERSLLLVSSTGGLRSPMWSTASRTR